MYAEISVRSVNLPPKIFSDQWLHCTVMRDPTHLVQCTSSWSAEIFLLCSLLRHENKWNGNRARNWFTYLRGSVRKSEILGGSKILNFFSESWIKIESNENFGRIVRRCVHLFWSYEMTHLVQCTEHHLDPPKFSSFLLTSPSRK